MLTALNGHPIVNVPGNADLLAIYNRIQDLNNIYIMMMAKCLEGDAFKLFNAAVNDVVPHDAWHSSRAGMEILYQTYYAKDIKTLV